MATYTSLSEDEENMDDFLAHLSLSAPQSWIEFDPNFANLPKQKKKRNGHGYNTLPKNSKYWIAQKPIPLFNQK